MNKEQIAISKEQRLGGKRVMENKKYSISFGIAFVCAMLFIACNNTLDPPQGLNAYIANYFGSLLSIAPKAAGDR